MQGKSRAEELRLVHPSPADAADVPSIPETAPCAISVENATLQYPVGPYARGSLKSSVLGLFGFREQRVETTYVDAIKGMNLNVSFGERVGVIGSNGSGKSTLLRALAGIYPLKEGSISVHGQIGTLLDIGLGFEQESTGRENIYYRGMAMGHSPRTLRKVEQQIIDFADLGPFIDLPMRTYSSGMYVRLGFAISTQISPDVLLVDEVFGAGDAAFAQRAVARMMEVVRHAGIVILASHDMQLIEQVCTRVVWLNNGVVVRDGPPPAVIRQFHDYMGGGLAL
jgi:lipopolysaccharide transport system ATP-binding protein